MVGAVSVWLVAVLAGAHRGCLRQTALVTLGGSFDSAALAGSVVADTALRVAWVALQRKLAADPELAADPWLGHVRFL